jgi:hypothetical protein
MRNNGAPNTVNECGLVVSLVRTFIISLKFTKSYFILAYHHFVDMETQEEVQELFMVPVYNDAYH